MRRVREAGKSGDAVDRSVKYQFGPLGGPGIRKCFGLQPASYDQFGGFLDHCHWRVPRLKWAHPSSRVQFILHMRVTVACAAHKSCAANNLAARMLGDEFLTAQTILCGKHGAMIEVMSNRCKGFLDLPCLCRNDREITVRNFFRTRRGLKRDMKFVLAAHT